MVLKKAILKTLDDIKSPTNYIDIYKHIVQKNYYDFKKAKTPALTVSALLGDFIRKGDSRIKRAKVGKLYLYYLNKNESDIIEKLDNFTVDNNKKKKESQDYSERDLHILLSTYLKEENIYSKTIFHEESSNKKDKNQKWIHPDMIGINFRKFKNSTSKTFLKAINKIDTFNLTSYEIKKEITSDSELKKSFFQAVSNSSWANFGYLVAFEINDNLKEEIERLNQSFGIGVIELKSNPYESKLLYPAKYKELNFKTIDKLCNINKTIEDFIKKIEKIITLDEKYSESKEKELNDFCDKYFSDDNEIEKYCESKKIPIVK